VNTVELLDSLYGARDEVTRLIASSSPGQPNAPDLATVQALIQKRDQITWTIETLIAADLDAPMADYEKACQQIDDATSKLKALQSAANDVKTAIGIISQVVSTASSIVATATGA
jgi:hypothetical protein